MKEIDVLRELFDEKIIKILNIFLDHPHRHLSLSEISNLAKVNIATTFRIVNKLIEKEYVKIVVVGKSKFYQIKNSDKTMVLFKFLKKEGDQLSSFIEKVKENPRIRRIILESKNKDGAKLLIVGNFITQEKIKTIADEIRKKHNFSIRFIVLNETQFEEMKNQGFYDVGKKVIWEQKE